MAALNMSDSTNGVNLRSPSGRGHKWRRDGLAGDVRSHESEFPPGKSAS
jgi:hypothetical protein